MKNRILFFLLPSLFFLFAFTIENAIVPKDEILSGGPPKDGIPALLRPKFVRPDKTAFLNNNEQVIGVAMGGDKAYPLETITMKPSVIQESIGDKVIRIRVSKDVEVTAVLGKNGNTLPHIFSYWFAWQAFHPDSAVYKQD
ncbi:MAG: DUF3179 domain-containing protein [Desulfobacteraceae bacterium]|nr:MAG: DUF3179 domain-containing protein [Desulfobacteraceae bacterium]